MTLQPTKSHQQILIIDICPQFCNLAAKTILAANESDPETTKKQYDIRTVNTAEEGIASYQQSQPDLVLLGEQLSEDSLTKVIQRFCHFRNAPEAASYMPIIVLAKTKNPAIIEETLEAGADDYCAKENIPSELSPRIKSALRFKHAFDELKAENENLATLTITDDLSGLHNMRYFMTRLSEEFTRADRYEKFLSLIMFDIDDFKAVNDKHDHLMGSLVLAEIGRIVHHEIRDVDIAARFGGDEYVIMLPETNASGAFNAATRITSAIMSHTFQSDSESCKVTISSGISTIGPGLEGYATATDLLRQADHFLYKAKDYGKNRVVDLSCSK